MLDFHLRAAVARSLSVASDDEWIPAYRVIDMAQAKAASRPFDVLTAIMEQARCGFITAKAVLAQAKAFANSPWLWEEREWSIPGWFWIDFTISSSDISLTKTQLLAQGVGPDGESIISLQGLHFHKKTLKAVPELAGSHNTKDASAKGRPPKYNWEAANSAVWGQIFRGDLKPKMLLEVEHALREYFATVDEEPSEAVIRDHANIVYQELMRE
ncbi:MAG: hypothetical protein ACO1OX_11915 [Novosphingobium sp.]